MSSLLLSCCLALCLALRGYRKQSLSTAGAVAAAVIGTLHMASGLEFGLTLIVFYLTSSKLTKWRSQLKARLEAGHTEGGKRTAAQVAANSTLGSLLAVATAHLRSAGNTSAAALTSAGFVGFYACCCADTWSSEVGIASSLPPRLITTGRRVPPGTNGGVSLLGTAAAAAGSLLIGLCYCVAAHTAAALGVDGGINDGGGGSSGRYSSSAADFRLVPLALSAGLCGSLLDSLLGATMQWSGLDQRSGKVVSGKPKAGTPAAAAVKHISGTDALSNTGVNVVSSVVTSALVAAVAWHWRADA